MGESWYSKGVADVYGALRSGEEGLSIDEAKKRLTNDGPNVLPESPPETLLAIFLRQFKSPLIYVLLLAAATMWYLGELTDAIVIAAVLLFNAVIGSIQEGRAQNTLRALKSFSETVATVVRGGEEIIIPDKEVVVGDVIVLREGEKVPADARVILARNLLLDEAALTGESVSVAKSAAPLLRPDLALTEQRSMLFKGTNVSAGSGRAIVVATGSSTHIGAIAREISEVKDEIPLQRDIAYLSRMVIVAVSVIGVGLFIFGRSIGHSAGEMFATVVTLAVSVIPEGLPVVMTIVLAAGVWRMSKRNALVKRLQAVEALGQAHVIATDKTGTITKNEMVVQRVFTGGDMFDISGVGYDPQGAAHLNGDAIVPAEHADLLEAARIAAFTASARVRFIEDEKRWVVAGDPTEAALAVFAQKLGIEQAELEREHPLRAEIPFDSSLKYHAVVNDAKRGARLSVVGAPEVILRRSSAFVRHGRRTPLSEAMRAEFEEKVQEYSGEGLRVVALAMAPFDADDIKPEHIKDLAIVALVGMKDGLRLEAPAALQAARTAGLHVVMITGDHAVTARSIASEAGIYQSGDTVLTGDEIDGLSDEELAQALGKASVFARVTPEHKLRIVNAYKARGEVIAMTGDGVNDAPSLVAADLGVSMGKIGTEVAKEASDIVLIDDNFGSIVAAIEEGRAIYVSIKKVIMYLFSTSVGEVLVIAGALFMSLPLPLLPAQIIWLNLVTDGFLDVALAMDPKEKGLLNGRFKRSKYLIDRLMAFRTLIMALPMGIGTLAIFMAYLDEPTKALTISLTTLAAFQWFNAWNCRSATESVFRTNPFTNLYLVGATSLVVGLQMIAVYTPLGHVFLHTAPLTLADWLVIIPIASSIIFVEEARKFFARRLKS